MIDLGNPTRSSFGSNNTNTSKVTTGTSNRTGYALGFNTSNTSGVFGKAGSRSSYYGCLGNNYNGYIDVVPGQTYTIVVGAPDSTYSSKGNNGFVKIAYGGDI